MSPVIKRLITKRNKASDRAAAVSVMIDEYNAKFLCFPKHMYREFLDAHNEYRQLDRKIAEMKKLPFWKQLIMSI